MQNNPNQEIRTNYVTDDVYKPSNANQLARSIHYDFVITQEMFDNYIANNPTLREIDIGTLLCSNYDGTAGTISMLATAPVSIYISALVPLDYTLNFTGFLITDVLDCTNFQDDGNWSATLTKDMVNVYSEHPYKIKAMAGGFNFWSNPIAYLVTDGTTSWEGVCRIGSYQLTVATNIIRPDTFQLVIDGTNIGTYIFTYNYNDSTPYEYAGEARPSVVYAHWMIGGGMSTQYSISGQDMSSPTSIKNGLFAQMQASMTDYGTEPVLVVGHNYASARYTFCGWNSNSIWFSNTEEGKTVNIYKNGRVVWADIATGTNGNGSDKVILSNFDISDIPLLFSNGTAGRYAKSLKSNGSSPDNDWDWAKITVSRNGALFKSITEDCPDYTGGSLSWYYNDRTASFKFKGSTELDYYTWGAIFAPISDEIDWGTILTDQNCTWWTPQNNLYLDVEDLKEGVVYTVRVHVMILPFNPSTNPEGSTAAATLFSQDASGDHIVRTTVYFCMGSSYAPPLYWGSTGKGISGGNPTNVHMNPIKQNAYYHSDSSLDQGNALEEIARAELVFVKLNGSIYVMKY